MADALWQSASMRALRPQFADERDGDNACALWQLPNWDEYSESAASVSASERSRLDISVCSSDALDFGGDSSLLSGADGDDDDAFKRGKLRRSPVSLETGGESLPGRRSVLQQLHLRYATQRQLEELTSRRATTNSNRFDKRDSDAEEQSAVPIETSAVRGSIDRGTVATTTAAEEAAGAVSTVAGSGESVSVDAKAIAAQQSQINSQLQSFRSQLTELQKRVAPDRSTSAASDATGPVGSEQQSSSPSLSRDRYDMNVQTEGPDLRDDSVTQWISLITQKIDLLAADYGHDATHTYRATIEHLASLKTVAETGPPKAGSDHQKTSSTVDCQSLSSSTWHVSGALHMQLSAPTVAKFVELEASLVRLSSAFEKSSRRKLDLFEQSIRQIENFHHEKLQQVVSESMEELKQVRGKYKARQEQLEEQVRLATQSADEWRQKAAEIEHKSTYERERIEFQAATFRDKVGREIGVLCWCHLWDAEQS